MKRLTHWTAAKLIRDHERVNDLKVRARYGALEGWASILVNLVLFVVKLLAGLSIRSVALIGDAVHTLADSATSAVIILGFRMAKKPSDKEHPFGHGRMESVAALIVAVLLFVAGVEILKSSVRAIFSPPSEQAGLGMIALIAGTLVVKELLSRFSFHLGDIIDSAALKADALHHRSDVLATALVLVALFASRYGYNYLDGVMGLFVAIIICYSGYSIARDAVTPLLGQAPSREEIKEVEQIALAHKDVSGVHDIIMHSYGHTRVVSLHIEVPDDKPPFELHEISEEIEEKIVLKRGGMAVVHIDPINKNHPQYATIDQAITAIVSQDDRIGSFHELRIVGRDADKCNAVFDIALAEDTDEQEQYDIVNSVRAKLSEQFPQMGVVIKAEPKYAYSVETSSPAGGDHEA